MVKYAPLYASIDQVARTLPDQDRLAFYDAFCNFCFRNVYPDFNNEKEFPNIEKREVLTVAWMAIAPVIEATLKRMEGGKKGGRPAKN